MYSHRAVVALSDHLARITVTPPSIPIVTDVGKLHELVCAVVDDLKASGWPPERVIVAVKQIAADCGLTATRAVVNAAVPLNEQDAQVVNMVRWTIERYYNIVIPPNDQTAS